MTKSTITRERLEALANAEYCKSNPGAWLLGLKEVNELARMALAAMDSEPVAYTDERNLGYIDRGRETAYLWGKQNSETGDVPLYRHAQPAPVVPAISDDIGEIRVGRLPTMNQDDYPGLGDWWVQLRIGEDSDEVLARVYGATPQEANNRAEALACRAAMLQAGDSQVSPAPFGYVLCNHGKPDAGFVFADRDSAEGTAEHLNGDGTHDAWTVAPVCLAAALQEVR